MIIGIDGNEANIVNRVGVNEYAFQIIWNLWKLQEKGENPHSLIVYLKEKPLPDLPKEKQNFKYKIIPGGGIWVVRKLMPYLFRNPDKIDIIFSPSHYTVPFSFIPRVSAIMDLGYLEFSGQFTKKVFWQLKWWSAMSIYVSKYIISISDSTKKEIVRHYPFAKNKVQVTHLGYDSSRFNQSISQKDVRRVKNTYSIVDDYILYISTLKPSKNVEGLVEAFREVSENWPKLQLVISGKKGWLYESIFEKAKKLGLIDKIVFTDFLPEDEKPALIKGAKMFVLPSFWEGFGLDPLYAMASGVPVVTSNVGSLPEVVGEAGVLVDPYNINSIAEGINKVLSMSKDEYNRVVAKGLTQAQKFSWEKCAKKTLEILTNER
jgi:glycosyltransferase involved in cell wall biosynthesis